MTSLQSSPGTDHPRIHETGLAADFLNRFNEAVMLLDLIPGEAECLQDFLAWTPCSYVEHFSRSRFADRATVLDAYARAPAGSREALSAVSAEMSRIIVATQVQLRREPEPRGQAEIARAAAERLKPLVVGAGAIVNGRRRLEIARAQTEIDAVFADPALQ